MTGQERAKEDRSLGELFGDLAGGTARLVRQEVRLAHTELSQAASRVGRSAGATLAGGAVAHAGFLIVLASAIVGLAVGIAVPQWVAALVVGVVVLLVGYWLVGRAGAALKREDLLPRKTIESLRRAKGSE